MYVYVRARNARASRRHPLTAAAGPERRDEEALVVEADEGPQEAVVALARGDAGVGAGHAVVDFPLLLHVGVLHEQAVADLGPAPHLDGWMDGLGGWLVDGLWVRMDVWVTRGGEGRGRRHKQTERGREIDR